MSESSLCALPSALMTPFFPSSLEQIRRYIEDKYVSGMWLSDNDRLTYLSPSKTSLAL